MAIEHPIDYQQLRERLANAGFSTGPAESHGLLCSLLCCGKTDALGFWLDELTPAETDNDDLMQECRRDLAHLYQQTHEAFEGPGVGFSLLMPEENEMLKVRAKALVDWCQGFLYGLGLAKAPLQQLSKETQEGLKDITEITRMDLDAIDETEQEEVDLTEITEFIWVAAMLVREELVHAPKGE